MSRFSVYIQEICIRGSYLGLSFCLCCILIFNKLDIFYFVLTEAFFSQFESHTWELFYLNPFSGFSYGIMVSCLFSILFNFIPLVIHILFFCSSGIILVEFFVLFIVSSFSLLLLFCSLFMIFCFCLPSFFSSFLKWEFLEIPCVFLPTVEGYFSFCFSILFFCILSFQLPVIFFILFSSRVCSFKVVFVHRRLVYFVLFVLATICSPPDLFSQFLLIFFLCFSLEVIAFLFLFLSLL